MENQIVQELTWARTRPDEVTEALIQRLEHYKGKEYFPPERRGTCVVTKEGPDAVRDAIEYVLGLQPMGGVGRFSERGLAFAGEDHVADIGNTGTASHSSSDGTCAADRARLYGTFSNFGECLWYGSTAADARTVVLDLIVDDGVPSRGHRKGVFNSDYDVVGVACGPHVTFGKMVAMEFARGWEGNPTFIRSRAQAGPRKIAAGARVGAKPALTTQWKLGACSLCNEEIRGGKVVDVPQLGGKLHAACFHCRSCSSQLTGTPFQVHGKLPYCSGCYHQRFGEKCSACGAAITGGAMKCALGTFHVECVSCATCGRAIGKNKFSTAGGVIACAACASGAKSQVLARGGNAQRRQLSHTGDAIVGSRGGTPPGGQESGGGPARLASTRNSTSAAKARPKPKPKPKASMASAKSNLMGLSMDYASLA